MFYRPLRTRRVVLLLFFLLAAQVAPLSAQEAQPAAPSLPVKFSVDHAVFAYGEDEVLVELYLAFDATSLSFTRQGQGFNVQLPLDVVVAPASDQVLPGTPVDPVWSDSLYLNFPVADTSAIAQGQQFLHQIRFAVPPGEYDLRVGIPGSRADGRSDVEVRADLIAPNYNQGDAPELSDITLASAISQSDASRNLFYKNGLIIRPNANQLYGRGLSRLYYYAEAYRVPALVGANGEYTLYSYIAEANDAQPIDTLQQRVQRSARSPDVLVGSFDISGLPSGSYFLHLALLDGSHEAIDEQARKFFVYNPGIEREVVSQATVTFSQSPFASMTKEDVARAVDQIQVIATGRERRQMGDLASLDARRRYLLQFWQKRDPDPTTIMNEYRVRFQGLLNFADERYSNNYERGWETDRGRTLIKYGRPDHVEPHLYERDMLPYEIWTYNNLATEGRSTFIFADREGFGDFELLHSTVTGERKMPDWQQHVTRD